MQNSKLTKKKIRLIDQKQFDRAIENLINVQQPAIEMKLEKAINPETDLDTVLTANDPEFKPLMKQYCNKSGKYIRELPLIDLQELITVYGRDESLSLLKENACSQYSPLWLHTEPSKLNKLMVQDVAGYFIYAASHIFHCDIITKTNLPKSAPIPETAKGNSTENEMLDNLLSDFPVQGQPQDLTYHEIPESADVRFFNLQDKIISRHNLELYCNEILITEANELLRRFLGLAKPCKVAGFIKFSFQHLYEITEDENNLQIFVDELKTAITDLFKKHFGKIKSARISQYHMRIKNDLIESADIANIKAKHEGLSNFHKQPKIRKQTEIDSILYDLRGFWDESAHAAKPGSQFYNGGGKDFNPDSIVPTDRELNKHIPKKGFRLNIGKKD